MTREPLLQYFTYEHLKPELREHSKAFAVLAHHVCNTLPQNPERTVALRKLLEAKDCAVRASLYDQFAGEIKNASDLAREKSHGQADNA